MTDEELIADFVKAERTPGAVRIMVADISWPSPSQPETTWQEVGSLPATATDEEIATARQQAVTDTRYFAMCGTCREKQPVGWMHDDSICQSCASRDHGILY